MGFSWVNVGSLCSSTEILSLLTSVWKDRFWSFVAVHIKCIIECGLNFLKGYLKHKGFLSSADSNASCQSVAGVISIWNHLCWVNNISLMWFVIAQSRGGVGRRGGQGRLPEGGGMWVTPGRGGRENLAWKSALKQWTVSTISNVMVDTPKVTKNKTHAFHSLQRSVSFH